MEQKKPEIRERLLTFPAEVVQQYDESEKILSERLLDQEVVNKWAQIGLDIAQITVRSWEAAVEYFAATPEVQRQLPSGQLLRWGRTGYSLSGDSPAMAVAYFKSSPETLLRLRPRYIDDWASICRALYKGTWKSSSLTCRFFEATPQILETINFEDFTKFGEFLELLSRRSYDQATGALEKSMDLFPKMPKEVSLLLDLMGMVADRSWRLTSEMFESISRNLVTMPSMERRLLLNLSTSSLKTGDIDPSAVLELGGKALTIIRSQNRQKFLEISDQILKVSSESLLVFLKTVPSLSERITFEQLLKWSEHGLEHSQVNPGSASAYFSMESQDSVDSVESLTSSIELVRVQDILRMYCHALSGKEIDIQASQNLIEKNIGWFEGDLPTTEGSVIYLPSVIKRSTVKQENFDFLKVISTHQISHIEFGSFRFNFEKKSTLSSDMRVVLEEAIKKKKKETIGDLDEQSPIDSDKEFLTQIGRFFDLFNDRKLALDVFTIVESTRVDSLVLSEYIGISETYRHVQTVSLENRPDITELPAKEALVELLIRISLGQKQHLKVPLKYIEQAEKIRNLLRLVRSPRVTVEDAAEITIRIYSVLNPVENDELQEKDFETLPEENESIDQPLENFEDNLLKEIMDQFLNSLSFDNLDGNDEGGETEGEDDYSSPQEVDYRGEFKPELSELLSQMEFSNELAADELDSSTITQEQLQEMMENSPEMELENEEMDDATKQKIQEMAENLLKELSEKNPDNQDFRDGPLQHVEEDGGPLNATNQNSFPYDEWDFRANSYKSKWCLVNEKIMTDGEPSFYNQTLAENSSLMNKIKKQFELVVPEMYRKQKRLIDGEEHDLDAVLEAVVDLRAGVSPDEKLYWRRNKTERSVAVSFLLDMSASTAEAIDENRKSNDDWGAPDDPVEYMAWLRSRRSEGLRKTYKRIVDVEKEGIVMLVNALEALGDTYGIFGFSGYGRENVEFYVIKDLEEKYSEMVPRRIDRIAPLHATRMGPAIRHTITKLESQDSRLRILFLISDGRPQDRGYSREGVEKEYAVHDTRKALLEAREKGIIPFCLTVDKSGHDYLKVMMDDFNYEVLPDINQLPERLPQLYKNLTT